VRKNETRYVQRPPRPRKRAVSAVLAMSQGDRPTFAEFLAAWEDGLVDVTYKGEAVVREYGAMSRGAL
jgi:hypothetical protein